MVEEIQNFTVYHEHCNNCYNIFCQIPAKLSVSCEVIGCFRNCGAIYHACKQEEHQLLCPNEMVQCLNVDYGCPITMLRCKLAKHLEVCPASVIHCSHTWNRWPVSKEHMTFCKKVSENLHLNTDVALDVGLALRDQTQLYYSIKKKYLVTQLMGPALESDSAGVNTPVEEASSLPDCVEFMENDGPMMREEELCREERNALAKNRDVAGVQNDSSWEKISGQEKEGCYQSVKNTDEEEEEKEKLELWENQSPWVTCGETGPPLWHVGIFEKLTKAINTQVNHPVRPINSDQPTSRKQDFYENLEPNKVKMLCSLNVPTSNWARPRHLMGPSDRVSTEQKSVQTANSVLSVKDLTKSEEFRSKLLFCLEKELSSLALSERPCVNVFYFNVRTQTYSFPSLPFQPDTYLADVIASEPNGLYVQTEFVTRRRNTTSSIFSFMCGSFLRRDEYSIHFRNVHCDIQASLNGWFQQRCPLAYLGCTFTQLRFRPAGQEATIKFRQDVNALVLQPLVPSACCEAEESLDPQENSMQNRDSLNSLPFEVLQHIAGYLDNFTLSQLSQVSHLMRVFCGTLLLKRGMVFLNWQKKRNSYGGISWRCMEKVWGFSSAFSSVDCWKFNDSPSMSEHLKSCSFYQREQLREPVALTCIYEAIQKYQQLQKACGTLWWNY